MKKQSLSPLGLSSKILKKNIIQNTKKITMEDKLNSFKNMKLKEIKNENIENISIDSAESIDEYESRMCSMANEIDYSNNCLITAFEDLNCNLEEYDSYESSTEEESDFYSTEDEYDF